MDSQKHSGPGIASFVLSILAGFGLVCTLAACGIVEVTTPGGMDENSPIAIILGLLILAFGGLSFMSLVLGLVGLLQPDRIKILAILGVVFSGTTILGTIGIMIVGFLST